MKIRINRFLSMAGLGSRRAADKLIKDGVVTVNGRKVTTPEISVSPDDDNVVCLGNAVVMSFVPTYMVLNKPRGYITSANDEKGRDTVFRLIHTPTRVFPIGRLDRDSEGLLLFTNDGELANRLLHPKYKVEKIYFVSVNRKIDKDVVKRFQRGIYIEKNVKVSAHLRFAKPVDYKSCFMTISEGKNRQIRKMFIHAGYKVVQLQRIQFGDIKMGPLKLGAWRHLTNKEITSLKKATALQD